MSEKNNFEQLNDEVEIDLLELAMQLLGQYKKILASAILVALIVFVYNKFLVTPIYESTSKLYVLSKSTSITSLTDLQIGSNLSADYLEVIKSRPVLDQVIADLGLDINYKGLGEQIRLSGSSDRIIAINVKDPSAQHAKEIADRVATVAAAYIAQKMDQDPPSIIQYGYSDEKPVSPNTKKNTLFGFAIGFLLAAAFVIVSYLINDSIISTEDVEKKLGMNVLGVLPYDDDEDTGEDRRAARNKRRKTAKKKQRKSIKASK